MTKITVQDKDTYIVLPSNPLMVYLTFKEKTNLKIFNLHNKQDLFSHFTLESIVCQNMQVETSNGKTGYFGEKGSEGLFWLRHDFYRREINPKNVIVRGGLEQYLQSSEDANFDNELVQKIARKIRMSVHPRKRDNPYFLAQKIVEYLQKNIEYVIVPDRMIEEMTKVINALDDKKPSKILEHFDFNKKALRQCDKEIEIDWTASSREIAKSLMLECEGLFTNIQDYWEEYGDDMRASTVLFNKATKCVGFSNAYTALARCLGIPSVQITGIFEDELHDWAKSYFQPYSWIEIDPTNYPLGEFHSQDYAYRFFYPHRKNVNVQFIGENEKNKCIDEAVNLLKRKLQRGREYDKALRFLMEMKIVGSS